MKTSQMIKNFCHKEFGIHPPRFNSHINRLTPHTSNRGGGVAFKTIYTFSNS